MPTTENRSPVRLYRRGRTWWTWSYDASGRRVRVSTRCTSRRAAEAVARRIEEQTAGCASTAPAAPYSVAEALQALLDAPPWRSPGTLASHVSRACQLARHFEGVDLCALDRQRVDAFIAARGREVSSHTIAKELVLLRLALRKAREDGLWSGSLEVLPRHRAGYVPRERWLETREASLLLADLLPHRRDWLEVALYTGARFSEVNGLDGRDVDLAAGLLRIRGTKTSRSDRTIPILPALRGVLRRLGPKPGQALVATWLHADRDLKVHCRRLGLKPATPNDLRRTTISWMAQAGAEPLHIARWCGTSLEMVQRVYAQVNPEALKAAGATLPKLRAARCDTFVPARCKKEAPSGANNAT